jgi:nucleotide-binding universal stress UspA family protein
MSKLIIGDWNDKDIPQLSFLVPLDGSRMAESVLSAVQLLASRFKAKVLLLHAIEKGTPSTVHGDKHLADIAEAKSYLENIATQLTPSGIAVEIHVHESPQGDVAASILEHAGEIDPDLVIMCTHGRGGVKDLLYGPIAQKVLHKGTWPVLLMPPAIGGKANSIQLRRILVPLDGVPAHELSLRGAIPIARVFSSELCLVMVIPTLRTLSGEKSMPALLLPGTMNALLDMAEIGSKDYLEQTVAHCKTENIKVSSQVLRGDAVKVVLDYADKLDVDLVAMASHGRAGIDAILQGSVAPRIAGKANRPLLLIRTEEPHDKD